MPIIVIYFNSTDSYVVIRSCDERSPFERVIPPNSHARFETYPDSICEVTEGSFLLSPEKCQCTFLDHSVLIGVYHAI